ncbi:MAG: hypothetical protein HY690_08375 [Chloroflexi bacterium]|nr:hypothetical protein [Chloroflexota bacterium]
MLPPVLLAAIGQQGLSPDGTEGTLLPAVLEICGTDAARAAGWYVASSPNPAQAWIWVRNDRVAPPQQGWKLHLSAALPAATEVLRRALPVLLAEDASFKVAVSLQAIERLNDGAHGLSQVGKFLTVYPNDDAQAVRLAVALDTATRGLPGPAIPSDHPLNPGSLVYYRYGSFGERHLQTPSGYLVPALSTPDGTLVPDQRLPVYRAPAWAVDPFSAAGVAVEAVANPLVGRRYLIVSTLHRSPRGAVHLAADLAGRRRCVLKRASRHAQVQRDGRDARDRLRYEAEVLARLVPDPRFPAVYGLVEQEGDLFLALEDVEGETLAAHVGRLADQGRHASSQQVVAWGRELAALLGTVHAQGLVYRDLKPPNVIVAPDGRLRLVDFDIAEPPLAGAPRYGLGSRGYMSPQQAAGQPARFVDDVYALGAVLFFTATGADPTLAPHPFGLLQRPLALLHPGLGPGLEQAIARCLDPDPAARYQTMAEVTAVLAAADTGAPAGPIPFGAEPALEPEAEARRRCRALAQRLGDALCQAAQPAPDGRGLVWPSTFLGPRPVQSRDLYHGTAGVVLALAELVAELDDPAHRAVLAEGVRGLAAPPPAGAPLLPGLYTGEAGVGAALLRAGQVLGDAGLVAAAVERGRWVAAQPYDSPDLVVGAAGRLRFHLLLWDETGQAEPLRHAVEAGQALLAAAEHAGEGGLRWRIPPGYDDLSGSAFFGYAHGAAGIADALLDLYEATTQERFLAAAQGAGRWLARHAVPTLDDGSGLGWPTAEGAQVFRPFWCYGAPGIGAFFLHAAQLGALPEALDYASRAARAAARAGRPGNPTRCHGLAGTIEFLLDVFQATDEPAYLAEARSLVRLLEAFAQEQEGTLRWSSDAPEVFTPDYMVGYAGVALCLLRLSAPERLPPQVSRRGFRRGAGPPRWPPARAGSS